MFDSWLRPKIGEVAAPVTGLRYFNVYGPGEAHKGRMASVVHQFDRQIRETGTARLFAGSHGYGDGEQRRDFVFVGDVAKVNLWAANGSAAIGRLQRRHRAEPQLQRGGARRHRLARSRHDRIHSLSRRPQRLLSGLQRSRAFGAAYAGYRDDFVAIEEGVRLTLDAKAQAAA